MTRTLIEIYVGDGCLPQTETHHEEVEWTEEVSAHEVI